MFFFTRFSNYSLMSQNIFKSIAFLINYYLIISFIRRKILCQSKDILGFLSLLFWIQVTQGSDFCQLFSQNKFSIDYGLQMFLPDTFIGDSSHKTDDSYLFIGQNYWNIRIDWDNMVVELPPEESQKSNWFGNQYKLGFTYDLLTPS